MQADQHYHTKVTGTVWCIENMTIWFVMFMEGGAFSVFHL